MFHEAVRLVRKASGFAFDGGLLPVETKNAFRPLLTRVKRFFRWSQVRDSNPRPAHYE